MWNFFWNFVCSLLILCSLSEFLKRFQIQRKTGAYLAARLVPREIIKTARIHIPTQRIGFSNRSNGLFDFPAIKINKTRPMFNSRKTPGNSNVVSYPLDEAESRERKTRGKREKFRRNYRARKFQRTLRRVSTKTRIKLKGVHTVTPGHDVK